MTIDQESNVPFVPQEEHDHAHAPLMAMLAALGIVEVTFNLSGGGDSGECDLESVLYADGRRDAHLPSVPIGFSDSGDIVLLDLALDRIASDAPDGDWCNNEGGYGSVSFFPAEPCPDGWIVCNMTYREEGDYGDDDEEEDFDDIFDDLDLPNEEEIDVDEVVTVALDASMEGAVQ